MFINFGFLFQFNHYYPSNPNKDCGHQVYLLMG